MTNVRAKISRPMVGCVDEESTRYALGCAQITPGKDCLWVASTDGRGLVFTRAEGEADGQCLMPTEILAKTSGNEHDVVLNGKWTGSLGKGKKVRSAEPVESRYPKVVPCLPDTESVHVDGRPVVQDYRAISLDTALLDNIGQALQGEDTAGITLLVPDNPEMPMLVVPSSGYQGVGVLMPVTIDRNHWNHTPAIERYEVLRDEIEAAYDAVK